MRKAANRENESSLLDELRREHDRWQYIHEHGCRDPTWPDGVNLNLVRNHILYYRRKIEENFPRLTESELYKKPVPPEVDNNYMARADEIRNAARHTLGRYKADPYYQYLLRHKDSLGEKQAKEIHIVNILGYVSGLEKAISSGDLVTMRRHESPEGYIESFKSCAEKVKELLETAEPNLFSIVDAAKYGETDFPEEEIPALTV